MVISGFVVKCDRDINKCENDSIHYMNTEQCVCVLGFLLAELLVLFLQAALDVQQVVGLLLELLL